MAFPIKLYVEVEGIRKKDIKAIEKEISDFIGEEPTDIDEYDGTITWEYEDDGMNEEVYITEEGIEELEKLLKEIKEDYDVDVRMRIWNLREPDFELDTNPSIKIYE